MSFYGYFGKIIRQISREKQDEYVDPMGVFMKNLWFTVVFLMPAFLMTSQDSSDSYIKKAKKAVGSVLQSGTDKASAIKNFKTKDVKIVSPEYKKSIKSTFKMPQITGADVTITSLPFWYLHAAIGYKNRLQEKYAWDSQRRELFKNGYCKDYPHFWNRIVAGNFSQFNLKHPIQSMKGNKYILPPVVGPAVASVLTGFSWHMLTDSISSKLHSKK